MRQGLQKDELGSSSGQSRQSLNGSFRKSRSGSTTSSKYDSSSRRINSLLKAYLEQLLDLNLFTEKIEDWVVENSHADTADGTECFRAPFTTDELRNLDYALEVFSFQQLFRMPCSSNISDNMKEAEYLALEDFLHTVADGLWRTFWRRKKPLPYFVSCPRYPGSKFYTVEKEIARGRLAALSGAALMSKRSSNRCAHWDDVVEFALFKPDIMMDNEYGLPSTVICEALFYGIHILLSRSLSKHNSITPDSVFILVLDSRCGGVVKLEGDVSNLEIDLSNPYQSAVEWIKSQAEVRVSPVHQIWNKLGNVNWGDLGTLQLLLATFNSLVQWNGLPRKSISLLAAGHSTRLQQRRIERDLKDNGSASVPFQHAGHDGEIVELYHRDYQHFRNQEPHLKLELGEMLLLEDQNEGQKCFQIQDFITENRCSYTAVAPKRPDQLLTLYVGAHPSRLEPSWEDMNLWYQVQRQTKILNILKEQGISCKYLPEMVASGRILHSGPCQKRSPKGRCDHPWCGTPILVTYPLGEPLSSIVALDGSFPPQEAIRCCRDCLAALRIAKMGNIQHGDICPENVIRVVDDEGARGNHSYVLASWGRAVLEERDSPAMNLQFSSAHALQHGKLCPSSDAESLVYLIYFISGGIMQQQDSIESALRWKQRCWEKRLIQQHLGEISPLLKAFGEYVDSLCGTTYPLDYDSWMKRLDRAVDSSSSERGKAVEEGLRIEDVAGSSGNSGGGYCF